MTKVLVNNYQIKIIISNDMNRQKISTHTHTHGCTCKSIQVDYQSVVLISMTVLLYLGFGHEHMTITPSSFLLLCHVSKHSCVFNVRTTMRYISDKMITDYHLEERRREGGKE